MENMKNHMAIIKNDLATKEDISGMATKEDISMLATKADVADIPFIKQVILE